jgi:hypothetical protein
MTFHLLHLPSRQEFKLGPTKPFGYKKFSLVIAHIGSHVIAALLNGLLAQGILRGKQTNKPQVNTINRGI